MSNRRIEDNFELNQEGYLECKECHATFDSRNECESHLLNDETMRELTGQTDEEYNKKIREEHIPKGRVKSQELMKVSEDNRVSPTSTSAIEVLTNEGKAHPQFHLREKLADLEHRQWSHWTNFMLCNLNTKNKLRWLKQVETDYKDLTEKEKESDRRWAEKVLLLISKEIQKVVNNNSNPCMKCGSVQCAICFDDLIKLFNEDYHVKK